MLERLTESKSDTGDGTSVASSTNSHGPQRAVTLMEKNGLRDVETGTVLVPTVCKR